MSIEWFEQSLERGMVLDELLFNPTAPAEERGRGAWNHRLATSPLLGKRTRESDQHQPMHPFRRKLRRSASTKMGGQSEALWAGITAASFEREERTEDGWAEHDAGREDLIHGNVLTHLTADANLSPHPQPDLHPETVRTRRQSSPLPSDKNTSTGVFRGHVVIHGFDQEKVGQFHLRHHPRLTYQQDKHLATALDQPWSQRTWHA